MQAVADPMEFSSLVDDQIGEADTTESSSSCSHRAVAIAISDSWHAGMPARMRWRGARVVRRRRVLRTNPLFIVGPSLKTTFELWLELNRSLSRHS